MHHSPFKRNTTCVLCASAVCFTMIIHLMMAWESIDILKRTIVLLFI